MGKKYAIKARKDRLRISDGSYNRMIEQTTLLGRIDNRYRTIVARRGNLSYTPYQFMQRYLSRYRISEKGLSPSTVEITLNESYQYLKVFYASHYNSFSGIRIHDTHNRPLRAIHFKPKHVEIISENQIRLPYIGKVKFKQKDYITLDHLKNAIDICIKFERFRKVFICVQYKIYYPPGLFEGEKNLCGYGMDIGKDPSLSFAGASRDIDGAFISDHGKIHSPLEDPRRKRIEQMYERKVRRYKARAEREYQIQCQSKNPPKEKPDFDNTRQMRAIRRKRRRELDKFERKYEEEKRILMRYFLNKNIGFIAVEDLNPIDFKNNCLPDMEYAGIFDFILALTTNMNLQGKHVIRTPWMFPSTQLCTCCMKKNPEMKHLSNREFWCNNPKCKMYHKKVDRDVHAAYNLMMEGMYIYRFGHPSKDWSKFNSDKTNCI